MARKSFYHIYNRSVCEYHEDGHPARCECGCEEFNQNILSRNEGCVYEYEYICSNEECEKIVGYWAYGHWEQQIIEI